MDYAPRCDSLVEFWRRSKRRRNQQQFLSVSFEDARARPDGDAGGGSGAKYAGTPTIWRNVTVVQHFCEIQQEGSSSYIDSKYFFIK